MRSGAFSLTTTDLTEDLLSARRGLGPRPIGTMDEAQLTLVLEKVLRADAETDPTAKPQLFIATASGKFVVSLTDNRLHLHDANTPAVSFSEHEPRKIVEEIERVSGLVPDSVAQAVVRKQRIQRAIAVLLLLFALSVTSYTVYLVNQVDDVDNVPVLQLVSDERELAALRNSAVGRYATGNQPGDRRIEISADGQIRFIRIVEGSARQESDDSYQLGRVDGKLWLATTESGLVQITNIDTLEYWHDVYRRVR